MNRVANKYARDTRLIINARVRTSDCLSSLKWIIVEVTCVLSMRDQRRIQLKEAHSAFPSFSLSLSRHFLIRPRYSDSSRDVIYIYIHEYFHIQITPQIFFDDIFHLFFSRVDSICIRTFSNACFLATFSVQLISFRIISIQFQFKRNIILFLIIHHSRFSR